MRRTDVNEVTRIERDRHPIDAWTSTMFHQAIDAADRSLCVVAGVGLDDVLAYGVVSIAADVADLDNLTVRVDVARRGIGRWLLRELITAATERDAREMLLEVRPDNEPAVALYRSEGFVEINRRRDYYAPGIDALVLRRPLVRVVPRTARLQATPPPREPSHG